MAGLLYFNDEIEYRTSDGKVLRGEVAGVSGSKVYLHNGSIIYISHVIRKIEKE
jgi:hypothetical protein